MAIETAASALMHRSLSKRARPADLSDEEYVQAALDVFLGRGVSPGQFRQQSTLDLAHALSAEELKVLDAVGMLPDSRTEADAEAARLEALNVFFHVFQSALPTAEAARRLKKDPSRIRQRVREGTLLAVVANGEVRLPELQFHKNAEIPGLRQVLHALPKGIDTLEALSWLATPTPDLADDGGGPRSPRDYLLQTGDTGPVIEIAEGLARGQAG
jgi:hypothetical protein